MTSNAPKNKGSSFWWALPAGAPASLTADRAQLKIRRICIYIDAELESLLWLAPVADAIVVEDPVVSLTHLGEGRYDIDNILDRLQPSGTEAPGNLQRFALYKRVLSGGRLDFNDPSVGKTHELRELNLSVPFLGKLRSKREIKTEPHLAFKLNGVSFDTAASGTPFAQTRPTPASGSVTLT